ncbi:MAG TPA: hypothetical protein PKC21_00735 [Oligoflexia bacterium]|nr:hypothetical protein [Oligoflexia bacterium]HMR23854.1 hypothetical protein [Oligoflexia bacterium]
MKKLSLLFSICFLIFSHQSAIAQTNTDDVHIANQVERYLAKTINTYQIGQHAYYARKALASALAAFNEGNYGIGALVLLVNDGVIYEFPGRNAMVTGPGITDHAEARALEDAVAYKHYLNNGKNQYNLEMSEENIARSNLVEPVTSYPVNTNKGTQQFSKDGYYVYGTLEPCPMCMVMIINAKANLSISSAIDGDLVQNEFLGKDSLQKTSNAGAMAIGEKFKYNPFVWQWIAGGQNLSFKQLSTDDKDLINLSEKIFSTTREEIDAKLGSN